ncbi:MAG: hypothetical protein DIZ80_16675 [endosymbiont of Galathealinum brachiosum]|uniref:Uncharacterized protein n=1 Tax=endosymbiont of Galathealinum brachiosum TaxID=2200906 RepID=A0A370D8G4_9GAMM|nr:MAG: hypothetical protein DIZ80_16675 [endosymbiont of Galathealinum brachiosum]
MNFLNEIDHAILDKMKETLDKQKGLYGWMSSKEYIINRYISIHTSFNEFYDTAVETSEQYSCNKKSDIFVNDISIKTAKLLRTWGVPLY